MILVSLQFRCTVTSAHMCSASECVLTGTAAALKEQEGGGGVGLGGNSQLSV